MHSTRPVDKKWQPAKVRWKFSRHSKLGPFEWWQRFVDWFRVAIRSVRSTRHPFAMRGLGVLAILSFRETHLSPKKETCRFSEKGRGGRGQSKFFRQLCSDLPVWRLRRRPSPRPLEVSAERMLKAKTYDIILKNEHTHLHSVRCTHTCRTVFKLTEKKINVSTHTLQSRGFKF